jgi:hypothetical protein
MRQESPRKISSVLHVFYFGICELMVCVLFERQARRLELEEEIVDLQAQVQSIKLEHDENNEVISPQHLAGE